MVEALDFDEDARRLRVLAHYLAFDAVDSHEYAALGQVLLERYVEVHEQVVWAEVQREHAPALDDGRVAFHDEDDVVDLVDVQALSDYQAARLVQQDEGDEGHYAADDDGRPGVDEVIARNAGGYIADERDGHAQDSRRVLEEQENLIIRQQEVSEILTEDTENGMKRVTGVKTVSGAVYHAGAVVLCTGVYLAARCIYGDTSQYTGPNGLMAANHLSESLRKNGIELVRFKTGTPARIDRRSIDFSKMTEQKGDQRIVPFSFSTDPDSVQIEQVSCWLTYTNEETHRVIRENIDRSPLYGGVIKSKGPRYCPSIEDKVMKFPDKDRHQVFIEPEGRYTSEMYIDGMSSSMPEDVQFAMYRSVPGLENANIVRNAYAIEYDCLAPKQLRSTLEFRKIAGLFSGGQFNGSSGYEEAAAQGLMAGINAGNYLKGQEGLVLMRSEAYIGVLIDDLVTKENFEPYRMMTSRAEYRLLLRQDNADRRIRKYGYEAGLISEEQMEKLREKEKNIEMEIERVKTVNIGPSEEINRFLLSRGSTEITTGISLIELIRRPELSYDDLAAADPGRPDYPEDVREQVNIEIKYEGYITRQKRQVDQFAKRETKRIPESIDYDDVKSLRIEARQKLKEFRPENIGQASRIGGVSPADVNVLLVYLKQNHM